MKDKSVTAKDKLSVKSKYSDLNFDLAAIASAMVARLVPTKVAF